MNDNYIIIAEDNKSMRFGMVEGLRREGYEVTGFSNGQQALDGFKSKNAALVITDLRMEGMNGIDLLEAIKKANDNCQVLLISAYGTVEDAVKAMRLGAADFITKPFSTEELRIRVQKLMARAQETSRIKHLEAQNEYLQKEISDDYTKIIGKSAPMQQIFRLIDQVAGEESAVLIDGESGTGKELVARAIHEKSQRNEAPFIRVNCGALNENLLESELFGHEKGSFTGAIRQKKGRFELADGGTLFLDEIGEISPAMQVKLLRALQEKEFERVGGDKTLNVDVRIIAATNRNLKSLIQQSSFREDLYYRLNVIPFRLPSLRERVDDIPLLVVHFLGKMNLKRGQNKLLASDAITLLNAYQWPGNIRELENLIERLHIISSDSEISSSLVAAHLHPGNESTIEKDIQSLDKALYEFEKGLIQRALQEAKGVKNRAAKFLGIKTSALYYKLEKFHLMDQV